MKFDRVRTAKATYTKDEFIRSVLIELARQIETPVDVVKADFGEVSENNREVLGCKAHVECDYTASIGYNRTEQYQTTESKYLNEGDWYTYDGVRKRAAYNGSYKVDCVKQRTVTDWSPHHGHISGDSTSLVFNEKGRSLDVYDEAFMLSEIISSLKNENVIETGSADVLSDRLEAAKAFCDWQVHKDVNFPGDCYKDDCYNSAIDVKYLECFILPFYEVNFKYNGKEYHASGFPCGDNMQVQTEYPPDEIDIDTVAENETKIYKKGKIAGWSCFAGLFCLACGLLAVNIFWMWIFPLIMLGVAVTLHILSDKKLHACRKKSTENKLVEKRQRLENVLADKNYDELTPSENIYFDEKDYGRKNVRIKSSNVKLLTIIASVAMVILLIVTFSLSSIAKTKAEEAAYKALRSPDQFTIQVISKREEIKNSYTTEYYVYLKYTVEAKDIGATYMKFNTIVYDNTGKELGSVDVNLTQMNLKSGEKKEYEIYLKDSSPDTFFSTLYNTSYSELSFKTEITYINFDEGGSYSK